MFLKPRWLAIVCLWYLPPFLFSFSLLLFFILSLFYLSSFFISPIIFVFVSFLYWDLFALPLAFSLTLFMPGTWALNLFFLKKCLNVINYFIVIVIYLCWFSVFIKPVLMWCKWLFMANKDEFYYMFNIPWLHHHQRQY